MEISSYTSNIQPYGYSGGIKLASDSGNATNNSVSTQTTTTRAEEADKVRKAKEAEKPKPIDDLVEKRIEKNKKELEQLVEEMDEFVNSINKGLSFRVDEEAGREVVTIYEASTGDIIRQIPDEEMLIILRRLAARNSGLFVEEKV
ncbi:flagellar protein FlaG [Vibrio sp. JC009]|uniref:flagellar protein FlaG n=1 Tax=Vibrio sp. JC009 TaxID=2912314 RepID=UPI0023AEE8A8|nr:flagellar protein FlaG [Vibrio sp. JC009]WED21072.1 flagellar protein FlaG [Vibrio sp. JC009]